jgi:hypothetical protein
MVRFVHSHDIEQASDDSEEEVGSFPDDNFGREILGSEHGRIAWSSMHGPVGIVA